MPVDADVAQEVHLTFRPPSAIATHDRPYHLRRRWMSYRRRRAIGDLFIGFYEAAAHDTRPRARHSGVEALTTRQVLDWLVWPAIRALTPADQDEPVWYSENKFYEAKVHEGALKLVCSQHEEHNDW